MLLDEGKLRVVGTQLGLRLGDVLAARARKYQLLGLLIDCQLGLGYIQGGLGVIQILLANRPYFGARC